MSKDMQPDQQTCTTYLVAAKLHDLLLLADSVAAAIVADTADWWTREIVNSSPP